MNADTRYSLFVIRCATDGNATNAACVSPRITRHASRVARHHAFTLVEVALAIAVVAIGLVGVLALFPLGLRATRGATDDTQMATIGQEFISKYQQAAMNSANFVSPGPLANDFIQTNVYVSGAGFVNLGDVSYNVDVLITNAGFPQMTNGANLLISRVIIKVSRQGSKTNTYFTEVTRYAP